MVKDRPISPSSHGLLAWAVASYGSILRGDNGGFSQLSRAPAFERLLRSIRAKTDCYEQTSMFPDRGLPSSVEAPSPRLRCGNVGRETEVEREAAVPM